MKADFVITINHGRKPMGVRVIVHENKRALRSSATQYTNRYLRHGQERVFGEFSDTLGICHRRHLRGELVVATVRLAPPNIGVGVISHELAHAAVWLWEIENKFKHVPIVCANDEWFCWVLGELCRCTVNKFIEKGLYNNDDEAKDNDP